MNPILDFGIDKSALQYVGHDLQRPECILAEPDGVLWSADARGGVMRIAPDGSQRIVTQKRSQHFEGAGSEAGRYLEGTLPNGLAFAPNGDILISNFGTDCLEIMTRDGESRVLADSIDGEPIGKVNFVLRDSKDRIWITVSTRIKNWMHALRTDLADGYLARYIDGKFRIVADGFRFTEVAKAVGIDFRHRSPTLDAKLAPIMPEVASLGASVSIVDFDRDGWPDIYLTNSAEGSRNALYRNLHDGTFKDVAGELGIADVNQVGKVTDLTGMQPNIDVALAALRIVKFSGRRAWAKAPGPMASRSIATVISGAHWCTPTSSSC